MSSCNGARPQICEHLVQAEQLKVVYQERAEKHDKPADQRQPQQSPGDGRIRKLLDDRWNRAPLPVQQKQRQTGEEHVGATLNRGWNILGPPLLERLSGHQAVLQGK